MEWRLYKDSSANTLNEVVNANGTDSFTASVASNRDSTCSTPPTLEPGTYWLVIRNTHASNTWGIAYAIAGTSDLDLNTHQVKTLGSALGSTLDFVAATWTKSQNYPSAALLGRVFGQAVSFS